MVQGVPAKDVDDSYRVSLEAGAFLYRAGDAATEMFLIREGEIELVKSVAGAECRLTRLRSGDVLGEVGMLEGASRETAARALTSCTLLKIDPATFLGLVRRRPEIAAHIIRRLGRRLSEALEASLAVRPVSEPAGEKSGQTPEPAEVSLGSQALPTKRRPGKGVTTVTEGAARLVDGRPGMSGTSYTLGHTTTIGRTLRNTIVIPAPDVSRNHARIDLMPAGFVLSDLNSQNGTFINGERIKEQVLNDNDHVRIGDEASFVFSMGHRDEDPGNARG